MLLRMKAGAGCIRFGVGWAFASCPKSSCLSCGRGLECWMGKTEQFMGLARMDVYIDVKHGFGDQPRRDGRPRWRVMGMECRLTL